MTNDGDTRARRGRFVRVEGHGSVRATPDAATVTLGVKVTDPVLAKARSELARRASAVMALLEASGVADDDLRTTRYEVSVERDYYHKTNPGRLVGYTANTTVEATLRDLDRLGEVLDAAVAAEANDIAGPQFFVTKLDALGDEACRAAMANARHKADLMAIAAGARLGPVRTIEERGRGGGAYQVSGRLYSTGAGQFDASGGTGSVQTPIARGVSDVSATVKVVWELESD